MAADMRLGQGDEYEIRASDRVVTDPKILEWRRQAFTLMGFEPEECALLAARADVDLHRTEQWLNAGATHLHVLAIVEPLP
jgi:hypothetical protein